MSRIGNVVVLTFALLLFACLCAGYRMKAIESDAVFYRDLQGVENKLIRHEINLFNRAVLSLREDVESFTQQQSGAIDDLQQRMSKCKKDKCECHCECDSKPAAISPFAPQRFAALLEVSGAFSRITGVYFAYAIPGIRQCDDAEAGVAMQKALDQARDIVNRSEVLFDRAYCEDMDRYFEIFRQLNRISVTCWHEYRVWIADLYTHFDAVVRDRIAVLEGKENKGVRIPLAAIPYAQRIKMKPLEYLNANKKHWERSKKAGY